MEIVLSGDTISLGIIIRWEIHQKKWRVKESFKRQRINEKPLRNHGRFITLVVGGTENMGGSKNRTTQRLKRCTYLR